MDFLMVMMVTLAATSAAQAQSQYGAPGISQSNSISTGGYQSQGGSEGQVGGQTKRYVSVHIAPEEGPQEEARVIRVPGGDKHVNIIFVKVPSASSSQQTEVLLPEQDEQKNIVYVLTKKASPEDGIKIRRPSAVKPSKPEVFFIRYKNQEQQQEGEQGQGGWGQSYDAPASVGTGSSAGNGARVIGGVLAVGSAYGAPAF